MHEVGYTDSQAFRMIFKNYTGLSPIAYNRKFNRIAAQKAF
jgi:AraC-like DNA-binding protein